MLHILNILKFHYSMFPTFINKLPSDNSSWIWVYHSLKPCSASKTSANLSKCVKIFICTQSFMHPMCLYHLVYSSRGNTRILLQLSCMQMNRNWAPPPLIRSGSLNYTGDESALFGSKFLYYTYLQPSCHATFSRLVLKNLNVAQLLSIFSLEMSLEMTEELRLKGRTIRTLRPQTRESRIRIWRRSTTVDGRYNIMVGCIIMICHKWPWPLMPDLGLQPLISNIEIQQK